MATTAMTETGDRMTAPGGRGRGYRRWLAGKTVSVVGLARSGVAAARLVSRLGGRVLASDAAPSGSLSAEAQALRDEGCRLWAGGHPEAAFEGADLVVVSPGVPWELEPLVRARGRGVPVVGELELAWRVMEADVVAVTGTNGKTTTTALVGELLTRLGRPVLVGGNIGNPLCAHALDLPSDALVVAEVSSFQLEGTDRFRPRVAAVLNVTPDHLDRHGTFERYVEAKARIFLNQEADDWAVLNADDPVVAALAGRTRAHVVWFSRTSPLQQGVFVRDGWVVAPSDDGPGPMMPVAEIPLRGQHNVENVLAAVACGLWGGMTSASIRRAVADFRGVPHRIERVIDIAGAVYYNDSKGTNVASTIKALESFTEPVILIAGGKGKGQDFTPLATAARGRVRHAILVGEDGPAIGAALARVGVSTESARSMEEAVRAARARARSGDVVLLSPACASFDMFRNFEHRGDVFKAAVQAMVP